MVKVAHWLIQTIIIDILAKSNQGLYMKGLVANLTVLGIWLTPVALMWNPQGVIAQTAENQMQGLLEQALQQTQQGQLLEAIETLKKLLLLAQQQKIRFYQGIALLVLGSNYNNIGEPKKALDYFQQALPMVQYHHHL